MRNRAVQLVAASALIAGCSSSGSSNQLADRAAGDHGAIHRTSCHGAGDHHDLDRGDIRRSTGNQSDRGHRCHTRRHARRQPRCDVRWPRGTVDAQGSLLFRNLDPGDGYTITSATADQRCATVADPTVNPPASFYASQPKLPEGGFGYITTRDGTTLSANVLLPGPADQGPYPTVVEYSGYDPSDPGSADLAQLYTAMGFAYVGVNIRGTGLHRRLVSLLRAGAEPRRLRRHRDRRRPAVGARPPGRHGRHLLPGHHAAVRRRAPNRRTSTAITPLSVIDDSYRARCSPAASSTPASPSTGPSSGWTRPSRSARAGPRSAPTAATPSAPTTRSCACRTPTRCKRSRTTRSTRPHSATRWLRSRSSTRSTCRSSSPARGRTSRPAATSRRCSTSSPARRTST